MTKEEEAIKELSYIADSMPSMECADWKEAISIAIKALKQYPVLDKIKADIKEWYWQVDKQALSKDPCVVDAMIDLFIRTIEKYEEPKTGHWIDSSNGWMCSECNRDNTFDTDYCLHCKAKMERNKER